MKTILAIIRKEFIQMRRDRRMFPMMIFSPVIQLLILGYAANLDIADIPLVVLDADNTRTSREFAGRFVSSGIFALAGRADVLQDIDRWIDQGRASVALVLPRGFGDDVLAGRTAAVQVIADGSESNSAAVGLSYASLVVAQYSRQILVAKFTRLRGGGMRAASVVPETRVWYNPALRSRNFMVPAVLALILVMMTMIFTSLAIVREKEAGTLEQLIVTPVRPWQLIAGKLTPFAVVALVDVVLVLLVATLWFHVPLRGSVPLLLGLCFVFEFATLGLGLLLSTIARTQQQAMLTAIFFVMMPMIMLSGFAFPIENMPRVIQPITYLMPLRYFLVIVRGIFLKGVGFRELWPQALALLVMGVAIFGLSVLRFRKKLE